MAVGKKLSEIVIDCISDIRMAEDRLSQAKVDADRATRTVQAAAMDLYRRHSDLLDAVKSAEALVEKHMEEAH